MRRTLPWGLPLAASLVLLAWTSPHLELAASHPEADGVLENAPTEVWLRFSVVPDVARTSFSVTGPEGSVPLGDITQDADDEKIMRAEVTGPMPPGSYTVSWVGAPLDDHTVRGRFSFSVVEAR